MYGAMDGKTVQIVCQRTPRLWELKDKNWCKAFLIRLAKEIKMTIVPANCHYQFQPNGGISATQIFAESHVAIHTWPERNEVRIVIDSCRDFIDEVATNLVQRIFKSDLVYLEATSRKYVLCKKKQYR